MDSDHQKISDYFSKIVREERFPHALLMLGPEGSGQMRHVIECCKMLMCPEGESGTYCDSCKTCHKVNSFVHPDIHFAFPVIKHEKFKREETTSLHFLTEWRHFLTDNIDGNLTDWLQHIDGLNKNANINVAECNQIIHNLGLKTYESKYKIQIIWHAESLMKEGNRLLKLIEEPSDDTIIILVANNPNAILNTIQSRCQIVRIPAYSDEDIEESLRSKFSLGETELKEIAYLSEGNIRKAEVLAGNSNSAFSEDMVEWFRNCYKGDPELLIGNVDHLYGLGKVNLKSFLGYTIHFLREFLKSYNLQSTDKARLSQEEKNVVLKMQSILDREKTAALFQLLSKNISYIDRNLSIRIMLMDLSLKINGILRAKVNKFA